RSWTAVLISWSRPNVLATKSRSTTPTPPTLLEGAAAVFRSFPENRSHPARPARAAHKSNVRLRAFMRVLPRSRGRWNGSTDGEHSRTRDSSPDGKIGDRRVPDALCTRIHPWLAPVRLPRIRRHEPAHHCQRHAGRVRSGANGEAGWLFVSLCRVG